MDLKDRSILLTGAGTGTGRPRPGTPARAEQATRLTLVGRRSEPLEEVAALVRERGATAHVVSADLTAPGAAATVVAAAQERFGGIALIGMPFYATYAATKAGIAHFGEALRRELYGEGIHVLNVFPGATSTPMMESSKAGPEHGFSYETPDEVAAAALAGIADDSLVVLRGGESQAQTVALNRQDPAALDAPSPASSPTSSSLSPRTPASDPYPHPAEGARP